MVGFFSYWIRLNNKTLKMFKNVEYSIKEEFSFFLWYLFNFLGNDNKILLLRYKNLSKYSFILQRVAALNFDVNFLKRFLSIFQIFYLIFFNIYSYFFLLMSFLKKWIISYIFNTSSELYRKSRLFVLLDSFLKIFLNLLIWDFYNYILPVLKPVFRLTKMNLFLWLTFLKFFELKIRLVIIFVYLSLKYIYFFVFCFWYLTLDFFNPKARFNYYYFSFDYKNPWNKFKSVYQVSNELFSIIFLSFNFFKQTSFKIFTKVISYFFMFIAFIFYESFLIFLSFFSLILKFLWKHIRNFFQNLQIYIFYFYRNFLFLIENKYKNNNFLKISFQKVNKIFWNKIFLN